MDFKLLNSLVNPVAEPVMEAAVLAPEAPAGEHIEIVDVEQVDGPDISHAPGDSETQVVHYTYNIHVNYVHPTALEDGIMVVANATLEGYFSVEDDRFSAPYGSTTAHGGSVYGSFYNPEWINPEVPQTVENMELFKMEPEKVQHIIGYITHALDAMKSTEVEQHVDCDEIGNEIWASEKKKGQNDYEPPEPDYD